MQQTMTTNDSEDAREDEQYERLLHKIRVSFAKATDPVSGSSVLFTTDAEGLWELFLSQLPADRRQHYTCHACRRFVERYGGLVRVGETGGVCPVFWTFGAPRFFAPAVSAVHKAIHRAKITGVFLDIDSTWGTPESTSSKPPIETSFLGLSGPVSTHAITTWNHMAVVPPKALVFKPSTVLTADQVAAEKLQDYGTLSRGLAEFPIETVRQAHQLLTSGNLYRSEKCIGVAKWLLDLHESRAATAHSVARENLTWLAVATAPAGFCHVRSSMIGTLLEDIQAGLPFADIKRKFDFKMSPLQYQRPTAEPSAGNIAQAEAIVQKLASAGALARRFAKFEDIEKLWTPRPSKVSEPPAGVFGHLQKKAAPAREIEQPPMVITWEKFARTVLQDAERIELFVSPLPKNYAALVTAANPEAPPILQWDREEKRNQVSWYMRIHGSLPAVWNLRAGEWAEVTAVTFKPPMWHGGNFEHQGLGVIFILAGARDVAHKRGGGFFPETLRSEYHGVRKTLEAYANAAEIAGKDEATACGLALQKGQNWDDVFRVTTKGGRLTFKIDRWD